MTVVIFVTVVSIAVTVLLWDVDDFYTIDDGPNPSNQEDGGDELEETVENTWAYLVSEDCVKNGSDTWEENVEDEANEGHSTAGWVDWIFWTTHLCLDLFYKLYMDVPYLDFIANIKLQL